MNRRKSRAFAELYAAAGRRWLSGAGRRKECVRTKVQGGAAAAAATAGG